MPEVLCAPSAAPESRPPEWTSTFGRARSPGLSRSRGFGHRRLGHRHQLEKTVELVGGRAFDAVQRDLQLQSKHRQQQIRAVFDREREVDVLVAARLTDHAVVPHDREIVPFLFPAKHAQAFARTLRVSRG